MNEALDDEQLSVRIPLGAAGCALTWVLAVLLLAWDSMTGELRATRWGLLLAVVGAAWTILLGDRVIRRRELRQIEQRMRKVLQEEQVASLTAARRP